MNASRLVVFPENIGPTTTCSFATAGRPSEPLCALQHRRAGRKHRGCSPSRLASRTAGRQLAWRSLTVLVPAWLPRRNSEPARASCIAAEFSAVNPFPEGRGRSLTRGASLEPPPRRQRQRRRTAHGPRFKVQANFHAVLRPGARRAGRRSTAFLPPHGGPGAQGEVRALEPCTQTQTQKGAPARARGVRNSLCVSTR